MSWVHHHKASTSTSPSTQPLLNINASFMPSPNPNVQKQKQVPGPHQPPRPQTLLRPQIPTTSTINNSSLLMTSQYPNKSNLSTNTTMRLNSNAAVPYPAPQQQQRQQQQAHLHGTSQPPPPPLGSTSSSSTNNNGNHNPTLVQGVFTNQQNSWQNQTVPSQNYLPTSKMMPQTQPPPPLPAAGAAAAAAANNNWQQQQNFQNSNLLYQQNATATSAPQHQWPQQNPAMPQAATAATYDNLFNHQANNNMYQQPQQQQQQAPQQQQQHPPPPQPASSATYYQQPPPTAAPPPPQTMSQTNAVHFFDNTNNTNNNQTTGGDGWGDWDWNDNSATETSSSAAPLTEMPQQQPLTAPTQAPPQQHPQQLQQQQPLTVANDQGQQPNSVYNSSIIADSFNQQNNDTWNWNSTAVENEQHVENRNAHNNAEQHNENWNWGGSNDTETSTQQRHTVGVANDHAANLNDNWNRQSNENQQQIAVSSPIGAETQQHGAPAPLNVAIKAPESQSVASSAPVPPPPTEFSSHSVSENHNYNTNTVAAAASAPGSTNIPNTVFVSQAKPVTLPSRQYASPPMGNTPVTENPPESALMPPQGFQNIEEAASGRPPHVLSPPLPPPAAAATPPAAIPTTAGMPPAAGAGNPFKRSGVAQHHRATGLMATVPAAPAVFNMPPPPPADFANPSAAASVSVMEPENNELPSQENQEILTPPTVAMLPQPQQSSASISLPNSAVPATTATMPPPNDERNQYLQTSHLSENSEEQQPETDGLLPPPGLSRLVLGEPELEASQRMVMGTDAPVADNTATVTDVMHLEERHADGEDTASENTVPVISTAGHGVAPPSSSMTSDRNLYLMAGESNANNQQRVVTGVELQEQREIEMDGENLEDQQQQQQQQQHQQQQLQHQHQVLSPDSRNEPLVGGTDNNNVAQQSLAAPPGQQSVETSDVAHHQVSKSKDPHSVSSHNDDDDSDERLLNDRGMNQSTAGSSKSRSKYDGERQASSRRRDKRCMNRYESDEYMNSEDGEYSSDREERERRDRNNDRRRNYREGSVRSDRGAADEDEKRNRRQNRDKRDKYYYEGEERSRGGVDRSKPESRRSQRQRGYDNDSRYETEESTRFDPRKDPSRRSMRHPDAERNRRGDRSDQGADYDDYNRRGAGYRSSKRSGENYESDRRDRRRTGDEYDTTLERRRRSDKHRDPRYRDDPRYDPREYEEYRKHSSRNARDSDLEKEGGGGVAGPSRSARMHHDPRHAAAMYGYPSTGGYYDPYTAYYYQQMARTNPQAYAEWYKKYYGQHAAAAAAAGMPQVMPGMPTTGEASLTAATNDGRESVHSGRSSAHNDLKDRYTHAYITQANEYHRHYHQHHHQHQQQRQQHQQQLQQHHHQQMAAFNQTLNSTLLDEDSLNQSISLYSGLGGGLTSAHSQSNLSQIHGGAGGYYVPPSALSAAVHTSSSAAAAAMYYARSDYAESRSGAISVRDPDPIATEPQRLTPCKFINEHTVVSFGSGVLVTVKPKYTPHGNISNIVKLLKFKPNDETRKLFKVFPGPLVRGLTHKKTVIEFCQEQIRLGPMETTIYAKQLITNNAEKYRGSYTLMWNLLILLLKQNGMVVGTDIAELLLKNQQQFPYQTPNSSLNHSLKSKSGSASPVEEFDGIPQKDVAVEADNNDTEKLSANDKEEPTPAEDAAEENEDQSLAKSSSGSSSLTEDDITEKFRNYLLYGNVNEALEWATDNNLWGHALFLASKLDRRSHANVMMKFANKLSLNDPLQTLYQLMSGRTPSSVTCVQDEKWGDWRPHLSMILSNTSQKPELDRKAITTLGDSLFNRGDLYASHFCYLMAQVGFGRYQDTATQETTLQQHLPKLILLGSSHYKQFQEFAHNEAIIMTEIYEYACSLNDEKFSIVEFQPYKFLLATRLLDYGFHLKSLMYLEQISVHIGRDTAKYESSFINKVYEMADRLKYYDPVLEKTIDDQQQSTNEDGSHGLQATQQQMEEQKWLQNLRQMAQQYQLDYGRATATTPMGGTLTSIDGQQQPQQQQLDPNYNYQQQQIDQQFMEINKQFSELNLQYQTNQEAATQQPPAFYNPDLMQQQQQQPPLLATDQTPQQPLSLDPYQSQPELPSMPPTANDPALETSQPSLNDANAPDPYQQQMSSYMQPDVQQQHQSYGQNYYDPSQQHYNNEASLDNQAAANSYDYWSQQQQQHQPTQAYGEENARPTISMPKSKSYDTDDEGGSKQQAGQKSGGNDAKKGSNQQQQQKNKENKEAKGLTPSNQNSGWFGGIWNKFSLKPKNQMILPDDKNPSIVWDADKKKWINTDGEEQSEESFKPPPKMGDLMAQGGGSMPSTQIPSQAIPQMPPQQPQLNQMPFVDPQQQQYVPTSVPNSAPSPNPMQQQQQQQPQTTVAATNNPNAPAPAKTPTLQSNMFKMQRNRTLKNAYVDVFNPSGAPVNKAAENILAPALPPAAVPQSGFFIPGGSGPTTGGGGSQDNSGYQQQQQSQDTPQFYNPNQYGAGSGY